MHVVWKAKTFCCYFIAQNSQIYSLWLLLLLVTNLFFELGLQNGPQEWRTGLLPLKPKFKEWTSVNWTPSSQNWRARLRQATEVMKDQAVSVLLCISDVSPLYISLVYGSIFMLLNLNSCNFNRCIRNWVLIKIELVCWF